MDEPKRRIESLNLAFDLSLDWLDKDMQKRFERLGAFAARREAPFEAGAAEVSPETQLKDLARQSVAYVEQLKRDHKLTLPETDIAAAWILTEVTQQGLNVTTDQMGAAVRAAFAEQKAE